MEDKSAAALCLTLSDEDLRAELKRREDDRKEKQLADHAWRFSNPASWLTLELIERLAPVHVRTSCSDTDVSNGLSRGGRFRCIRCALLDIRRENHFPTSLVMRVALDPSGLDTIEG